MYPDAFEPGEKPVYGDDYTPADWRALQEFSQDNPGHYTMPCCGARAIPKTSPNGVHHFAHYGSECANAPETIWHQEAKDLVIGSIKRLGLEGVHEFSGGSGKDRWRADVMLTSPTGPVAVEIQRSHQHIRDFVRRTERYTRHGIRCVWIVRFDQFQSLVKRIFNQRYRAEVHHKRSLEEHETLVAMPDFFYASLSTNEGNTKIGIPRGVFTLDEYISAVSDNRFVFNGDRWVIQEL